jgi:hypothetical protein
MIKRIKTIGLCLLLSVSSYSQGVLIDSSGDTLVTITLEQMDNIYSELLQKDKLTQESEISSYERLLLLQLLDSSDKDIELLKTQANSLSVNNRTLLSNNKLKDNQIKSNRKLALYGWAVALLSIFVGLSAR